MTTIALAVACLQALTLTASAPKPGGMQTGVPAPDTSAPVPVPPLHVAPAPGARPPVADLSVRPPGGAAPHAGGETRCALCHSTAGWKQVTFSHDRTGFPLTGRHRAVTCAACHRGSDFTRPVARACAACHRDVHAQRLGQRCDRCHDTGSFKQASFGADAHRRTAFPLSGRHATIPCEECHGDRRDRTYARPVVQCVGCHQKDYDRTAADPRLLSHVTAGFSTDCRTCHGTWRFNPGAFPAHETCFAIRSGRHAGIGCRDCHTGGLPPYAAGQVLTCSPTPVGAAPADCMHCHGNPAAQHQAVAGYLPSNPRCYECHRFSSTFPGATGGLR